MYRRKFGVQCSQGDSCSGAAELLKFENRKYSNGFSNSLNMGQMVVQ